MNALVDANNKYLTVIIIILSCITENALLLFSTQSRVFSMTALRPALTRVGFFYFKGGAYELC